jgi:hypothetical protein
LTGMEPPLDTLLGTTVFPLNRVHARVARETCFRPPCATPRLYIPRSLSSSPI